MPKIVREMTALEVRRLTHPGHKGNSRFPVGGVAGLMLQITEGGGRSWVFRVTVGAKRRNIGLGTFPAVSLGQARQNAVEMLEKIRQGTDPVDERKAVRRSLEVQQNRITFNDALEAYHSEKAHEFGSEKHRKQWLAEVERLVGADLGPMLANEISTQDVLRALRPHWLVRTDTARRVRGRIEQILAWATVSGHRAGANPAAWTNNLDKLLPRPSKIAKSQHQPALATSDAAPWFSVLRERDGIAARALEFLSLTAARSGEVRGATWAEIDLDVGLWVVPGKRMKAGREHRVPLAPEAVMLLRALPRFESSEFVFAAPRGGQLSDMSLSAVMRRLQEAEVKAGRRGWIDPTNGRSAVPHGLRSTFRQWTAEMGFPRDMSELALAHFIGSDVERAYQRSDMLDRRSSMMAAWAKFLSGEPGERVVFLREALL